MKTNWQTKKLSDVCFFQEGPGIRKYEYKKNGYPIINVRCVQDGYIDLSNAQAVDPKFIKEKWAHFQVEEGDILFTTSGTIGRTAMVTKDDLPLLMNTSVVRFKSLDEKELDRYFLAWLLRSPKFIEEVKSYSSGTAQKNVGPTHLKLISISYPPLSEQKRIVKILDEAFKKIGKAEENVENNLQNSKELFESYLQNVFVNPGKGWERKKIEECFKLKSGDGLTSKMMSKDGGYPVFGGNGIAGVHNKFNLSGSNVIIGRVGALCGNVRHITEKIWLTDNAFKVIDFKYDFDHSFLTYMLNLKNLRSFARQAAQPVISNSSLKDVVLTFPKSLTEQKNIVNKLDELSEQTKKLEEVYIKKMADLEELKKSVLNKAFTGEL
jgi:type I restriction enzyme S subunit